jgi:urease accessory protein
VNARSTADSGSMRSSPTSGWTDTDVSVRLRRGTGGRVRVDGTLCSAPVWFRWDGATLWMVGSGASPVGEDDIRVRVDVGPGVDIAVRSVAATVVYAARGVGTRWTTEIHVDDGAVLSWRPEPVILTEHARHQVETTVHAASGAEVTLDEVLVLGRAHEVAGSLRSTLDVRVDGDPVLLTSIDTSTPAWAGPAGVGQASAVAHRLRLGGVDANPSARVDDAALLEPAAGCRLAVGVAADVAGAHRKVCALLPG